MPEYLSDDLKDLIANMLTVSSSNRFSATQCLAHKWFKVDDIDVPTDTPRSLKAKTVDSKVLMKLR